MEKFWERVTWNTPLLELLLGELKIKKLEVFSVFDYQAVSKNMSWSTEMSNFLADAIITSFCCNLLLAKKPGQKRYSKIKIFWFGRPDKG